MPPPTTEQLRSDLLTSLTETFEDVRGIYLDRGTSLFETVDTVSAAEASWRGADGRATIAAHVEHVRLYLDVLDDVLRTQALARVNWREVWETVGVVTPDAWDDAKARLRASYRRVVQTIATFEAWDAQYGLASALAVVAHSAYHLGAIRQILATARSAAPGGAR